MLIPIRDDNPTSRRAWVTLAIIAVNVLVFLLWQRPWSSATEQTLFAFCHAEIPWEVTHQTNLAHGGPAAAREIEEQLQLPGRQFQEALQGRVRVQGAPGFHGCPDKSWWQSVFVAMFLHGGWLHIGGNMLFLWIFGNNVEDRLGPILYFLFYIAAGIVATLAQLATGPNSVIPNLGASGAIAGVLGAYIVMFPRRRVLTIIFFFFITFVYLPAWVVLLAWFVLQLFSGVGGLSQHLTSGVAYFAHIGGFVFGAVLGLLFFPKEGFMR